MTKQNNLGHILRKASLQASKPDMEEAWNDLLVDLDEQMPQKRKKRPFIYLMPILLCLTAMGSLVLLEPSPALTSSQSVDKTEKPTNAGKGHPSLPAAGVPSQISNEAVTDHHPAQQTGKTTQSLSTQASPPPSAGLGHIAHAASRPGSLHRIETPAIQSQPSPRPGLYSHENLIFFADADSYDWLAPDFGNIRSLSASRKSQAELVDYIPSPEDMDNLAPATVQKTDNLKEEKKNENNTPPKRPGHKFAIGASLSYNFNNFTTNESRNSNKILNGAYQAYKQIGINVYCRIPLSRAWQVQPELGLAPQSTRIQINYHTEGLNTFSRYQINRMLYSNFGFSGYYEPKKMKNVYLIGGVYYAYALPHYGGKLEQVNQEPGKDPVVMSSMYEHRDFRKDVFGLNRNDYGILGGIEWHRGRLTSAVRFYRGLTDVTPETPTNYHNFNISLRFGYHLEFSK